MTLLASANSPRLPRYCALAQSKHSGKAALPLVTLGGTPRGLFGAGSANVAPCQGTLVPPGIAGKRLRTVDGQMDGRRDRGDPSVLGKGARAAVEGARMAPLGCGGYGASARHPARDMGGTSTPRCPERVTPGVTPVPRVPQVPAALCLPCAPSSWYKTAACADQTHTEQPLASRHPSAGSLPSTARTGAAGWAGGTLGNP